MSEENQGENLETDRFQVEILGVVIGTADGWYDFGDCGQQFTAFEVDEAFKKVLPTNCVLAIDYQTGILEYYPDQNSEGIPIELKPFLELIAASA